MKVKCYQCKKVCDKHSGHVNRSRKMGSIDIRNKWEDLFEKYKDYHLPNKPNSIANGEKLFSEQEVLDKEELAWDKSREVKDGHTYKPKYPTFSDYKNSNQ